MLPRLYELKNGTHDVDSNGYGFFNAVSKCNVTEEKNGEYFCELEILPNDRLINKLSTGLMIKAKPNHKDKPQLFEILNVKIQKNGIAAVTANHIKQYFFNNVIRPSLFDSSSYKCSGTAEEVINKISSSTRLIRPSTDASGKFYPYQYVNVIGFDSTSKNLKIDLDQPLMLADIFNDDGGIIQTFGGEFHYDNFNVYFYKNRGSNTNKIIRYGSNISDYTQTMDNSDVYTSVYPYAKISIDDEDVVLEVDVARTDTPLKDAFFQKVLAVDFSDKFKNIKKLTDDEKRFIEDELTSFAQEYVFNRPKKLTEPTINITVTYQPELDKLQKVGLCDTVKVIYGPLEIVHSAQIIKTVYDSLNERYVEMEIGEKKLYLTDFLKKSNRRL